MSSVSVVIPTRNRAQNLLRTLSALKDQDYPLLEVLVVDSSDHAPDEEKLRSESGLQTVHLICSEPSVCLQRNLGIKAAKGDCVLLLDDDISLDPDYVKLLVNHLAKYPNVLISSGLVMEKDNRGNWQFQQAAPATLQLLWKAVFQLGLWSQLSDQKARWPCKGVYRYLHNYYNRLGNGITKAGWPVISHFESPVFRTRIYGLGASLIRRDWLLDHLYDERLDQHGIGDNYGIAIALSPDQKIEVLTGTRAYHHKSPVNRLAQNRTYYFRILALDYFSSKHRTASSGYLCWSLVGNTLSTLFRGHLKLCRINLTLIWLIGTNQNPLLKKKS